MPVLDGVRNRTELELAQRLGSHGAAVVLQAVVGTLVSLAVAYLSYELFESRFLGLKRWFETTPQQLVADALAEATVAKASR
jgi:peptidoglycan/LPS O-acetylase OafA/YrhL